MPRYRTLASFALFIATSTIAFAQSPTPSIATVAFNNAVLQTAQAQHDLADLQTKFAPRQTHLQTLNTEIETLKRQLSDTATTLTPADREAKLKTLDADQRQLQRDADDYKSDTDAALQHVFQATAKKLYDFLQTYAKQHAYTLVIDRGSDTAPIVWYAAANTDITDDLVKAFDHSVPQPANASPTRLPSAPSPHK